MKFTKMHGAGNDFIIINNMDFSVPADEYASLAVRLCAFHTGVGADGIMIVVPPEKGADFKMLFYNSDGSEGEMCGNGARCIARYGHDKCLSGDIQRIETISGTVTGERISEDRYRVRLNDPSLIELDKTLSISDGTRTCSYVMLGDPGLPHVVTLVEKLEITDRLRELGRQLRSAPELPKGANVSFVSLAGDDLLDAVTFERGVEDFTLACGTGAGSITAVLTLKGIVSGKAVKVRMPGGTLEISLRRVGDSVSDIMLTGPAATVFEAELA